MMAREDETDESVYGAPRMVGKSTGEYNGSLEAGGRGTGYRCDGI